MTITTLLLFMVLSQVAMAGYLLYSFNSVERGARQRNADMRAYFEATVADLERRLNAAAPAVRKRAAGEN
jgi:hypothetical protein